jgi:hypothetical protein
MKFYELKITAIPRSGSLIKDNIEESKKIINSTLSNKSSIEFTFNGVNIKVTKDSSVEDLLKEYERCFRK